MISVTRFQWPSKRFVGDVINLTKLLTTRATIFACLLVSSIAGARSQDPVSFRRDVAPILQNNCVACHGARKAEGGYRLDTFDELLKAGDSGETPIAQGQAKSSELLRRLTTADEFERMPAESDSLSSDQIQLVSKWINEGAKFDGDDSSELLTLVIPPPRYEQPPETYPAAVPITALAFSPDGRQVFASGYHEVTVWSAAEGKLVGRIGNVGQRVHSLAVSPDQTTLAVACGEPGRSGELRLVDLASGQVRGVASRASDVVLDVAFRPGHDELAVAAADHTIKIINFKTLEHVRTLASHADWVTSVAWSDDGTRLASASRDKSAKIFDPDSGSLLVSYQGHGDAVRAVAFLPDGNQVVSVGDDKRLHRWNVADAKKVATVDLGGQGQQLIRGKGFVLIPCTGGRLLKIDLSNNRVTQEYQGHSDWVLSAALDPEHASLVSGSFDGEVRLWNLADAMLVRSWLAKP